MSCEAPDPQPALRRAVAPGAGGAPARLPNLLGVLREVALAAAGLGLVAAVTGPYLSFALLYLAPVVCAAWWGGSAHGTLVALAGTVAWHCVDAVEHPLMPPAADAWNGVTRFATLALAASLVARLHQGM